MIHGRQNIKKYLGSFLLAPEGISVKRSEGPSGTKGSLDFTTDYGRSSKGLGASGPKGLEPKYYSYPYSKYG
jgi:hypothetical protein